MSEKVTEGMARAAAQWWVARIRAPKFDNLGPTRGMNYQETATNDLASMMAILAAGPSPEEEALKRFEDLLTARILSDPAAQWSLGVDYGPDAVLYDAATEAGISPRRFPWKSHVWFRDGKVEAACGYGSLAETIYTEGTPSERQEGAK